MDLSKESGHADIHLQSLASQVPRGTGQALQAFSIFTPISWSNTRVLQLAIGPCPNFGMRKIASHYTHLDISSYGNLSIYYSILNYAVKCKVYDETIFQDKLTLSGSVRTFGFLWLGYEKKGVRRQNPSQCLDWIHRARKTSAACFATSQLAPARNSHQGESLALSKSWRHGSTTRYFWDRVMSSPTAFRLMESMVSYIIYN